MGSPAYSFNATSQRDRLNSSEISINRVQGNHPIRASQIWYVSAVAFRLQKNHKRSATELASEIADVLNHDIASVNITIHSLLPDRIWRNCTVQAVPPGWIHLKLNEVGLQEWLNAISDQLPGLSLQASQSGLSVLPIDLSLSKASTISPASNNDAVFAVLSTHARCCSLLRLGMQEQTLQLEQPDPTSAIWRLTYPNPLNWLNGDRRLHCNHTSEWQLLVQILDTLDSLECLLDSSPSERLWKLSYRLSQAFQAFHANCRIFGAMKTDDRSLAQARLGLVFLTQALLYWMLRNGLNTSPPIEL